MNFVKIVAEDVSLYIPTEDIEKIGVYKQKEEYVAKFFEGHRYFTFCRGTRNRCEQEAKKLINNNSGKIVYCVEYKEVDGYDAM